MIGGRKQEAFQSCGFGCDVLDQGRIFCCTQELVGGHELSGFEVAANIEHCFTFAYGERVFEYLAIGELPKNVMSGGGAIEEIFAGLERATRMAASVKFKGDGV